jgi:DNA-binding protein HU-beta
MSKAFIAEVIRGATSTTHTNAKIAATNLMDAISEELKKVGRFSLPGFGTFTVRETKARKAMNPRTGETIHVKEGKTVRFKASKTLRAEM